jgi:hypothetical protein
MTFVTPELELKKSKQAVQDLFDEYNVNFASWTERVKALTEGEGKKGKAVPIADIFAKWEELLAKKTAKPSKSKQKSSGIPLPPGLDAFGDNFDARALYQLIEHLYDGANEGIVWRSGKEDSGKQKKKGKKGAKDKKLNATKLRKELQTRYSADTQFMVGLVNELKAKAAQFDEALDKSGNKSDAERRFTALVGEFEETIKAISQDVNEEIFEEV